MNVLFISLIKIDSIQNRGIYPDLLRQFISHGHTVYILSAEEDKARAGQEYNETPNVKIIPTHMGKIQKTDFFTKGINMVLLGGRIKKTIKKHLVNIKIDLLLYATPPVTIANTIRFVKKRDGAKTYLMLKDIIPDGMVGKEGVLKVKGLIYHYFRHSMKNTYAVSDYIGCMSPACVQYLLRHDPQIPPQKIGMCPNSIEVRDLSLSDEEKASIRQKYGLPANKTIFVYGGNLGKPQGIPFIIECLKSQLNTQDAFFLIVGNGTEYGKLEEFFSQNRPANMKLMKSLPKEEYDRMIAACDVGLVFLDHKLTLPNIPSRILSYMQAKLPILACTDPSTDLGKIITDGGFGWWCESDDVSQFKVLLKESLRSDMTDMGEKGYQYLLNHYSVEDAYGAIMSGLHQEG